MHVYAIAIFFIKDFHQVHSPAILIQLTIIIYSWSLIISSFCIVCFHRHLLRICISQTYGAWNVAWFYPKYLKPNENKQKANHNLTISIEHTVAEQVQPHARIHTPRTCDGFKYNRASLLPYLSFYAILAITHILLLVLCTSKPNIGFVRFKNLNNMCCFLSVSVNNDRTRATMNNIWRFNWII